MKESNFFEVQSASSRIKAMIISEYFPKYCKIIQKTHKGVIRYLDLFAGPGFYKDQKASTPILVGIACARDPALAANVHLMFNDKYLMPQLQENFNNYFSDGSFRIPPRFGSLEVGADSQLTEFLEKNTSGSDGRNKSPTLLFIDPFGYKGVETKVLAKFMKNWGNEIFLFVNIKRINPGLTNDKFDDLMRALFPTKFEEIRKDKSYQSNVQARISLIVERLADEYRAILGEPFFHTAFKFQEEDSTATSHYILHFTKHGRGYDLVKQIYNEFDNVGTTLENDGTYAFDAKKLNNDDASLFDHNGHNIDLLRDLLIKKYKGMSITAAQLFEEHHTSAKFSRQHYTNALRYMVANEDISSTFTDGKNHYRSVMIIPDCLIQFPK